MAMNSLDISSTGWRELRHHSPRPNDLQVLIFLVNSRDTKISQHKTHFSFIPFKKQKDKKYRGSWQNKIKGCQDPNLVKNSWISSSCPSYCGVRPLTGRKESTSLHYISHLLSETQAVEVAHLFLWE